MRVFILIILSILSSSLYALDYPFRDLNEKDRNLNDYLGKWVIVNYWATWCPPCLNEIPELVAFHRKHQDDNAVVIGFNLEDIESEELEKFVVEFGITYPIVPSHPDSRPVGELPGLPVTFLINPAGELVARHLGEIDQDALESYIFKENLLIQP